MRVIEDTRCIVEGEREQRGAHKLYDAGVLPLLVWALEPELERP